jgi:hypothetical protein
MLLPDRLHTFSAARYNDQRQCPCPPLPPCRAVPCRAAPALGLRCAQHWCEGARRPITTRTRVREGALEAWASAWR